MTKRQALGTDPLAAVVPPTEPSAEPSRRRARPSTTPKIRATFHIPLDLYTECRDAVWQLTGPPARLTMTGLAEHALRTELDRMKNQYNGGKPFPARDDAGQTDDADDPPPNP